MRARALLILIASLSSARLPVFGADSIADSIALLRSRDAQARVHAVDVLVKAGPSAVPKLLAAVDNRNELAVTLVLARMGQPAVDKLIELLGQPELRAQAGEALYQVITPAAVKQAPALIDCLKDEQLKHSCGRALVKVIGPKAKSRVPALLQTLKSRDKDARMYACLALGQIGPRAKSAVPELILALKDDEAAVRRSAAGALGKLGSAAKAAAPALEAAAQDGDGDVRRLAAEALKKIST